MTTSTTKQVKIELVQTSKDVFCDGLPDVKKNFKVVDVDILSQELKENQILVQAEYISGNETSIYILQKCNVLSLFVAELCVHATECVPLFPW